MRRHCLKLCTVLLPLLAIASVIISPSDSYASGTNSGTSVNIIQDPIQWVFNNDSGLPSTYSPVVDTTTTTLVPVNQAALENGGEVTVGVQQLPSSLNPYTAKGANSVASMVESAIWPGVFAIGPMNQMVLQQSFVQSAEVVGINPQRVEYQIVPNAKWSSGQPITAYDFTAMWHFFQSDTQYLPPGDLPTGYSDIQSIVSLNKGSEALVTFTHPYANWDGLFSTIIPPWLILKTELPKLSNPSDFVDLPSGGPFVVKSYIPGKSLLLAQNPNYFGTKSNLEYIKFLLIDNSAQLISDLADGKVDIAASVPNARLSSFLNADPFVTSTQVSTSHLWQIVFNVDVPPLANVQLRDAIASIVDRPQLFWDTQGIVAPDPTISNNQLFLNGYPQSIGNSAGFQQSNLINAMQYLAAAKYHQNKAGKYVSKSGALLKLTLLVPQKAKLANAMAKIISVELDQAGITVFTKYEKMAAMLTASLPEGKFQFALAPYNLSEFPAANAAMYVDPDYSVSTINLNKQTAKSTQTKRPSNRVRPVSKNLNHSSSKTSYGLSNLAKYSQSDPYSLAEDAATSNVSGFNSSAVSSLLQQASQQLNTPISIADYNQADALIWQKMPTLPLFQLPAVLIVRAGVENVTYGTGMSNFGWDMGNWGIQLNPPIPILH